MSTPEIVEEFSEDIEDQEPYIVGSLTEFIPILEDWHARQVKTVNHFLSVPEGQVVQTEGESEFALSGDALRGFRMGISIAMHYLGTLPFSAVLEEEDPVAVH